MFAEDEARLLVAEAGADLDLLERLVARREAGEPLEQVVGWAELAGVRVGLRPGVFVPRQRSRLLVDLAVDHLRAATGGSGPTVVVDLCCGSGALGLAVAHAVPDVELHAADLDTVACACAADNLRDVGVVHRGDLLGALPERLRARVGVLLVNAPYVPSDELALLPREARDHEPALALDGGPDGTALHRRVAEAAPAWVGAGGIVVVETSPAQADATAAGFDAALWSLATVHDDDLDATAVQATRR